MVADRMADLERRVKTLENAFFQRHAVSAQGVDPPSASVTELRPKEG